MFSSFGGSGDGISFDDFFGFSEETSSVVVESKQITQVVSSSVNKKVDTASSSEKKQISTQAKAVSKVTLNIPKNQPKDASSSEESEEESSSDDEQMNVIQISDEDEEMKENDSSSTTSSDSGDSDEESENIVTRKSSNVVEKQTISKPLLKTNVEKKAPPKQSTLPQILNNTSTSSIQAAIVEPKKKKPSPVKEKRKENESPKRKFIQTRLDKSMFEKRAEQPQGTDSSLFCVCCNMYIALTNASSQNSAKRVKKGSSRYEEWNQHITCEEHLLRKERLQRLNVLCFMNGPSSKRFHHFVNSFCLMFFHKIEAFAVEFSKKNRKRIFEIEDCEDYILLDYVINFIYARVSELKYTTNFEKILKTFLNSMRQNSLKIATTIWEQNKEFYNKMADDDFGYLLSDIVHRSWDCMRHLAYFGKVQDPVHLFIDEPLEFEDYIKNEDIKALKEDSDSSSSEEESDDEEDDIFSAQHPYFETFMKMYIQHFLFLIPIEKIMSEAVEMYKSILEEGTYFDEWEVEILKRKNQFLSQSENNSEQTDNQSSGEESPTIPLPKTQAPKQKSIEDLLFGSAANNTFESFFSINTTPKKPIIVPNQTQGKKNTQLSTTENETMEEEDMWSSLRRDNM